MLLWPEAVAAFVFDNVAKISSAVNGEGSLLPAATECDMSTNLAVKLHFLTIWCVSDLNKINSDRIKGKYSVGQTGPLNFQT